MRNAISKGNIMRRQWPMRREDAVSLYLGNGRFGGSFDAYGLNGDRYRRRNEDAPARTTLMHADHWHRGNHGLDYWLPVARLVWDKEPEQPPCSYSQELDIYDSVLTTRFSWTGLSIEMKTFFHSESRDLLVVDVRYEAVEGVEMPSLVLAPETDLTVHYDQHLTGSFSVEDSDERGLWMARVRVGNADSAVAFRKISTWGQINTENTQAGLRVNFIGKRGKHLLVIGSAGYERREELSGAMLSVANGEELTATAIQGWHRRWGDSYISVPVQEYQALWARSMYYVLCSYAPEVRSPAAPMGWSGRGWPFHFPQDVSYIHPALLRLGHLDIAKAWVEFYRGYLDNMRSYTKRIYGAEGTMWAWEFPIGADSSLLQDSVPNVFQYEIHNAAYPARMAWETAQYLRDDEWTKEVAWPIIYESARFFGSILRQEDDGTWGIHLKPSMGQDERGGANAKNYLCSLFSALYCLRTALQVAEQLGLEIVESARWNGILTDGLAFGRLLNHQTGIYSTWEGSTGSQQVGKQKHPVQLNPLIFLPLGAPDKATINAYHHRDDLCVGGHESFYHGWTLATYWLAASHMGQSEDLLRELAQIQPGRYGDPDWIQIYETSAAWGSSFYVTSHGLLLQALNDAFVSDFWGSVEIGAACPESWQEVEFHRLHTADGRVWSGRKIDGKWQVAAESR